jgi:hypothetical protein
MIDAHRLNLVFGSRGRRSERAAGNFLGFKKRMFLGDRLRYIDRQKLWLTLGEGGRGDGVGGDLAVQRSHGHERIDG